MLRLRNRFMEFGLVAGLLSGVMAAGSVVLTASPAAAHTRFQACGSGFVDVTGGHREVRDLDGVKYGDVYLMYRNGYNCVVTMKTSFHGTSTWTEAYLKIRQPSGSPSVYVEAGNFGHYAGGLPLGKTIKYAAGKCVQYLGVIFSGRNVTGNQATGGRIGGDAPNDPAWGNCG